MQRKGSPFKGVGTITLKEAADHLTSARMHLIMGLVLLTAVGSVYGAVDSIRTTTAEDPYLFLRLFTTARDPLPSFAAFLGFLVPLVAIALGFDSVNGEYSRRTMSRLLAQPIYRDAVLFGKFLGGLLVMAIALLTLWLLMVGVGILFLGLPPSAADLSRSLVFLAATLAYAGVWLALSIAFSTLVRSPATSALAALAVWLVLSVFWNMVTPLVAGIVAPVDLFDPATALAHVETQQAIARLSPQTLYGEVAAMILDPTTRTVGPVFAFQLQGAIPGAALPTVQSVILIWPQIAGLVAAMLLLFTIAYVSFQRQEVRA